MTNPDKKRRTVPSLKPYAIAGIGAGSAKRDPPGISTNAVVFNFGAGADVMLRKEFGLYGEVTYKVHAGDLKLVNGVTNLNFGVLFKS